MKTSRLLGAVYIYLFLSATSLPMETLASLVAFQMTGTTINAEPGNVYGLSAGDTIEASGVFDSSELTEGTSVISFLVSNDNLLRFDIGGIIFREDHDVDYCASSDPDDCEGSSLPQMVLVNGMFDHFDYHANLVGGEFLTFREWVADESKTNGTVNGQWNPDSFVISAIPIPPAVWMFGSGLLGLIGIARRKKD